MLGHALYMKAIHGSKSKNDRVDAYKIAALLRGGNLPQAYVYPAAMRATRNLLCRRTHLVRKRAELLGHIKNTACQYNLPSPGNLHVLENRAQAAALFPDPAVRRSVELDLELINTYDPLLRQLETELVRSAKIHDISRFPRVQDFCSYCRLIGGTHESAGKPAGSGGKKIGNVNLKWAFSEAAVLLLAKHIPPPGNTKTGWSATTERQRPWPSSLTSSDVSSTTSSSGSAPSIQAAFRRLPDRAGACERVCETGPHMQSVSRNIRRRLHGRFYGAAPRPSRDSLHRPRGDLRLY